MSLSAESQPVAYYFISYSRQELTVADSFSRELGKRGINSWVDFRNLIPGHSWQQQLDQAIQSADAILLVVSKASMASPSVKDEWTTALAQGKRIVLILFEPSKLDSALPDLEWVDFTGDFDRAMTQLIGLLAQPPKKITSIPPQRWIRLPSAARKFTTLSILMVVMSVVGICLIYLMLPSADNNFDTTKFQDATTNLLCLSAIFVWLPAILIFALLPLQFLRRTHNAQTIRNLLVVLLAASLLLWIIRALATLGVSFSGKDFTVVSYLLCVFPSLLITVVTCIYLNRLLLSEEMYRWSGPTGAVIRIATPNLTGHTSNGPPMQVAVEYAPQDRPYAQELKASITNAGHICTDDLQNADIVLPLLSVYKTSSACDPEITRLIPVLMQSCDVDPRL
jgi:hypothetical protein